MKKILLAFTLLFGLNAFAQTTGSTWKLIYVWDGIGMTNVKAKKSDFLISIPEKKISGIFGCNKFNGNFEYTKGDHIKPIKLANTKENCPEKPDPQDKLVLNALKMANKVVIGSDKAKFYQGTTLVLELNR